MPVAVSEERFARFVRRKTGRCRQLHKRTRTLLIKNRFGDVMKNKKERETVSRTTRHFSVSKAFDVPLDSQRLLDGKTCCEAFFIGEAEKYKSKKGCYVFALRNGGGVTPYYVGKTKKSFGEEAFASHKISHHYQPTITRHQGTPVLTFVAIDSARGRTPDSTIREVEKYLIQAAYAKNPRLSNVQNLPKEWWSIDGVMNASRGKPCKIISDFRSMMGI